MGSQEAQFQESNMAVAFGTFPHAPPTFYCNFQTPTFSLELACFSLSRVFHSHLLEFHPKKKKKKIRSIKMVMEFPNKTRKGRPRKNLICFALISFCCFVILAISTLRLPEASPSRFSRSSGARRSSKFGETSGNGKLGKFGEMMVEMLPDDLAFTVFVPSERAFERDLGFQLNGSLSPEKWNDTCAVVSRVLGFSAIPRAVASGSIAVGEELCYDSLSGFRLYISKDSEGMIVVNGVQSERVDLRKNKIVVHVMDGTIMDFEFEQSAKPDLDGND